MRLLIIRHGIAEDRDEWAETGKSDDARPLTDDGAKKMARVAEGLVAEVPKLVAIATSPLVRARQTAAVVALAFELTPPEVLSALAPGGAPADILAWVNLKEGGTFAVVGHEPDLGALIEWCIAGRSGSGVTLKKGGAALIEFGTARTAGSGTLRWLLQPSHLRSLAAD